MAFRSILALLATIIQLSTCFSLFSSSELDKRQINSQPKGFPPPPASTFVTQFGGSSNNFTFSITATNLTSGDIWFRISAPTYWSWVAVGVGNQMAGSTIFVLYQGGKGDVILSARKATGHIEPSYDSSISLENFSTQQNSMGYPYDPILNGITDTQIYATGICRSCVPIMTGNTKQNFIYAAGPPGRNAYDSSLSAALRVHEHYGFFTLDMTKGNGLDVPALGNSSSPGMTFGGDNTYIDVTENIHAFAMMFITVILLPIGIFLAKVLKRINLHMGVQSAVLVIVILGFVCGVLISKNYNRTKGFNNVHQIFGILVIVALLAQWVLGFLSHRHYVRTGYPLGWAHKVHKYGLGAGAFVLMMVNVSLGFRLALAGGLNILYWPIMAVVLIILLLTYIFKNSFRRRWGPKMDGAPGGRRGGALASAGARAGAGGSALPAYGNASTGQRPYYEDTPDGEGKYNGNGGGAPNDEGTMWGTRNDIALENMHARSDSRFDREPPPYDMEATKPREFA